ncbi:hypothetical protein GA707_06645 [Nostocoides sp. F2B08]|uniref:hypothetical protein n=1 Tax=Nostocoides sp. F2B08 TaxID=2653936 RepID=UPI001262B399|nr:hypothetical protein [Tetrasphaera sp. F2B08]KAB7745581.1 hypothetical protein GA707_06645 [Tetrasphaera sp. F2B08]
MSKLWSWLRARLSTLVAWVLSAGATLVAFEICQNSIDATQAALPYTYYRWLGPAALAAVIVLAALLTRELLNRHSHDEEGEAQAFAHAVLAHARRLHRDHRHTALLRLRGDESLRLHVLGRHEERRELGDLALQSAGALNRDLDKAAILIDDLGWANYLLGDTQTALANMAKGTSIAENVRRTTRVGHPDYQDASILEARGIRHQAVIGAAGNNGPIDRWISDLDNAQKLLTNDDWQHENIIRQEIAQIHHSRAFATVSYLGVNRSGTISPTDTEGRSRAAGALESLRKAEKIFRKLSDDSRLPKVYLLRTRVLEALGDSIDAKASKALAEQSLRASPWAEPDGIQSILGPSKKQ